MPRGESSNVVALEPVSAPPAPIIRPTIASALQGEPAEGEFIVQWLIPKGELTLFAGQADIGKSWLSLMLMCACGLEQKWLRCKTRRCKSLGLFTEEPEAQLHARRNAICRHYGADPRELDDFVSWFDRRLPDPRIFKGGGRFTSQWKTMPLWQDIRRHITEYGVELLLLDNASTVAETYEDSPMQVKNLVRWLISEAEELNIAIVLLVHPPASDQGGEKWYAGTRMWRTCVRNAIVLQKAHKVDVEGRWWVDNGRRHLLAPKNNYLPHDHWMRHKGMEIEWRDGMLQRI